MATPSASRRGKRVRKAPKVRAPRPLSHFLRAGFHPPEPGVSPPQTPCRHARCSNATDVQLALTAATADTAAAATTDTTAAATNATHDDVPDDAKNEKSPSTTTPKVPPPVPSRPSHSQPSYIFSSPLFTSTVFGVPPRDGDVPLLEGKTTSLKAARERLSSATTRLKMLRERMSATRCLPTISQPSPGTFVSPPSFIIPSYSDSPAPTPRTRSNTHVIVEDHHKLSPSKLPPHSEKQEGQSSGFSKPVYFPSIPSFLLGVKNKRGKPVSRGPTKYRSVPVLKGNLYLTMPSIREECEADDTDTPTDEEEIEEYPDEYIEDEEDNQIRNVRCMEKFMNLKDVDNAKYWKMVDNLVSSPLFDDRPKRKKQKEHKNNSINKKEVKNRKSAKNILKIKEKGRHSEGSDTTLKQKINFNVKSNERIFENEDDNSEEEGVKEKESKTLYSTAEMRRKAKEIIKSYEKRVLNEREKEMTKDENVRHSRGGKNPRKHGDRHKKSRAKTRESKHSGSEETETRKELEKNSQEHTALDQSSSSATPNVSQ